MNKRVVPKVSGLVKVGSLTAAPEADVAALPDFESGAGSAAKTTPRLFVFSSMYRHFINRSDDFCASVFGMPPTLRILENMNRFL